MIIINYGFDFLHKLCLFYIVFVGKIRFCIQQINMFPVFHCKRKTRKKRKLEMEKKKKNNFLLYLTRTILQFSTIQMQYLSILKTKKLLFSKFLI